MGCGVLILDCYVQDERYFAIKHMDVRREAFRAPHVCPTCPEARHHTPVAAYKEEPAVQLFPFTVLPHMGLFNFGKLTHEL